LFYRLAHFYEENPPYSSVTGASTSSSSSSSSSIGTGSQRSWVRQQPNIENNNFEKWSKLKEEGKKDEERLGDNNLPFITEINNRRKNLLIGQDKDKRFFYF
jgi:hypothetical protein